MYLTTQEKAKLTTIQLANLRDLELKIDKMSEENLKTLLIKNAAIAFSNINRVYLLDAQLKGKDLKQFCSLMDIPYEQYESELD